MTPAQQSQSVEDRVHELVAEGERRLESVDQGADPADAFDDLAAEASDLVEETDPRSLLDAISGDGNGDERPETFPEAMAQSDAGTVVVLRKLLLLAEIDDDGSIGEMVDRFRALSDLNGERAEAGDQAVESESAAGDEADAEAQPNETVGDEVADTLQRGLQEGVDEFREGIERMRSELQDADESDADDSDPDERDGGGGEATESRGTMFSTMPSSERPDMGRPLRFSTVRGRTYDDSR